MMTLQFTKLFYCTYPIRRHFTLQQGELYTVTITEEGASTLTFNSLTSVLDDTYKCAFSIAEMVVSDSVSVIVNG